MIYEKRIYQVYPGKMPNLLNRFDKVTLSIWERYQIRQAGFWTSLVGGSSLELLYMLEWDSLSDRETKWSAFTNDPEWLQKRAESEKDGPIVASIENSFLEPTSFSKIK
ncbi:MAG: NIPSNAP family protein [Pseudomonadota bacterium]|nr:NIPSNAP family protein [Pseudomonadota bacterium]